MGEEDRNRQQYTGIEGEACWLKGPPEPQTQTTENQKHSKDPENVSNFLRLIGLHQQQLLSPGFFMSTPDSAREINRKMFHVHCYFKVTCDTCSVQPPSTHHFWAVSRVSPLPVTSSLIMWTLGHFRTAHEKIREPLEYGVSFHFRSNSDSSLREVLLQFPRGYLYCLDPLAES